MKYLILTTLLVLTQYAHAISVGVGYVDSALINGRLAPASAWSFSNSPEQFVLSGSQLFVGSSIMHGDLDFWLNEPVKYSIQSLGLALLNEGGSFGIDIFLGAGLFLPGPMPPAVYNDNVQTDSPLSAIYLSDSGLMDPGHYTFHYFSRLDDGIAASGFNFTMSRVPDAGSSLLLMSLGLGAIGLWRHRTV